ncbi:prepilin-type N-terminal cleavage/methylation domain-containing protein [Colwellia echini]|uniref:Prepilin-type N-terminal cleavage/methylation domain-containing protein n=1 Tax=Colwellia echini TaxID=1982103 RepID=A0ABY3N1F0_9GAMM|nr:prepilin-type N-terminal cleavage/methylation domain-containing protein [Colwellia echini]TYK67149.1 prepilin-type N-terminal cleavage/methylation domain-containing protein [Colwellia echini]
MHHKGFTLIELIVVIILISILAVSIAPKFDSSDSYEAHSHRAQLIAALRLTQQRAMQQTDSTDGYCHQIVFDRDYPRYGIPDRTNCDNTAFPAPDSEGKWSTDATGHLVDDSYQISFNIDGEPNPQRVAFDWMGRPTADCEGGCIINITHPTASALQIIIEEEGYIHAF